MADDRLVAGSLVTARVISRVVAVVLFLASIRLPALVAHSFTEHIADPFARVFACPQFYLRKLNQKRAKHAHAA